MIITAVLYILGLLMTILAASMLIPMGFDIYFGNPNWQAFGGGAVVTGFIGTSLWLSNRHSDLSDLTPKRCVFADQWRMGVDRIIWRAAPILF